MPKKKMTAMQKKMKLLRMMRGRGGGQSKVSPAKAKEIQKEVKRIVKEEQNKKVKKYFTVHDLNNVGFPKSIQGFMKEHK
jgi:hypothetical protein